MSDALCRRYKDYQVPHSIKFNKINTAALKVIDELEQAGFDAFLVGGCIRDVIAGIAPKDFDVATNATPEQTAKALPKTRIIGRRFKIVHARRGSEIIEITTFRGHDNTKQKASNSGRLLRDNHYGSILEDAQRRDFTSNALYYHPNSNTLLDFCQSVSDINSKTLRIIGDPATRYIEDPVRMLRAVRFSGKLGFSIEEQTQKAIGRCHQHLGEVPAARLFDEVLKLLMSGYGLTTFKLLCKQQLFQHLFPITNKTLKPDSYEKKFIEQALINTDKRIQSGKHVTPAYLYAALMWPARKYHYEWYIADNTIEHNAKLLANQTTIEAQQSHTAIPKRFSIPMREIWDMQSLLEKRPKARCLSLLENKRFRAAYDFLLLRNIAGEPLEELCEWWTTIQQVSPDKQQDMVQLLSSPSNRRARRRRG